MEIHCIEHLVAWYISEFEMLLLKYLVPLLRILNDVVCDCFMTEWSYIVKEV